MKAFVHHKMTRRLTDWLCWVAALLAMLFLLFVLSAPPIMQAIVQADLRAGRGCCHFPAVYQMVISVLESESGSPLLWYFNEVWRSEVMMIGQENGPGLPMVVLYVAGGLGLIATATLPFWRRRVWRYAA
jgi:hypothetical protein